MFFFFFFFFFQIESWWCLLYFGHIRTRMASKNSGGRTRLPKFKFSANFPIGLHVILQIQILKKKSKMPNILGGKYLNRKSVSEVQPWAPLEVILNEFCSWITVRCIQRSRKWVLPNWIRLYLPPLQKLKQKVILLDLSYWVQTPVSNAQKAAKWFPVLKY